MKNKGLYSMLMLVLLFAFGCKSENKSGADLGGLMGNDEQKAAQLIDAYNNYLNVDSKRIEYTEDAMEYATNVKEVLDGNSRFATGGAAILNRFNTLEKLPDVFGDKQEELQKLINQNEATFIKLEEEKDALEMYMKAENYKDDNAAKGNELVNSIHTLGASYFDVSGDLIKKLRPLVNDAEKITLKNDPLKDHILAMKNVMYAMDGSLDKIDSQYNAMKVDKNALQESYTEIEKSIQEVKSLEIEKDDVTNQHAANTYKKSFVSAVEDYLAQLTKTMRDAEAENEISDSNYKRLEDIYNRMIQGYNYFIDA